MNLLELLESVKNACHLQRRIGCNSKCPFYISSQYDCCVLTNSNPRYWNVEDMAKPLIVQYTNNNKYYVCPYCGRRFLYYENWREFRYCYACGGGIKQCLD